MLHLQQQQIAMNSLINHQNHLNENSQINLQNKNIQLNSLNSVFNPMSKGYSMMHVINSPKIANPQQNTNLANFIGRPGMFHKI